MIDKNLFLYDLAIVAIFKNEARYLKEWIDYHLLAGVEHFYLSNNDSTDNYKEILAPYIEKNLVTLTEFPGKIMQCPAYEDAIEKYRFESRYMAFIDIDEFIYPKTNRNIVEVVDEILLRYTNAAGLAINWQMFGSSGLEKSDYSRGVLERFMYRSPSDLVLKDAQGDPDGNAFIKTLANPRLIKYKLGPHGASYLANHAAVNSNGDVCYDIFYNEPCLADKIVINHYFLKSKEEFLAKFQRGHAAGGPLEMRDFQHFDHNEVFDDGILKYRTERTKNFSFENDQQRVSRVVNSLVRTLTQNPSKTSLVGKLETFLTCSAVAKKFQLKIGEHSAEEIALAWIYQTIVKADSLSYAEIQQFLRTLPDILTRPFPICKDIKDLTQNNIIPRFCEALKSNKDNFSNSTEAWRVRAHAIYLQKLLSLIK